MSLKYTIINLVAGVVAFIVNLGINLLFTPYLVGQLGSEAYGYIGLANNFVSYVTIITIAINSLAGRFVAMRLHVNDIYGANEVFNSVLLANMVLVSVISFICIILIQNLQSMLNISIHLVKDVQITFFIVFANFFVLTIGSVFSVATFARNRLYLTSIKTIIGYGLRVIITIPFFLLFNPHIFYISAGMLVSTLYITWTNINFTRKLLPEIEINILNFRFHAIKEIITSGIWASLNNLSNVLLTGLGLLLANMMINEQAMGLLSLAQPISIAFQTLLITIAGVFAPQFTMLYAKGQHDELVHEAKFSIKMLSLLMTVPFAGFIVFGRSFFALWLPSKTEFEIIVIQNLSVLTLLPNLISGYFYSLYSINTVTNHLKVPVIVNFCSGVLSIAVVLFLLDTTTLGVYAIAGTSGILLMLRVLLFTPMYTAYTLGQNKHIFYPPIYQAMMSFGVITLLYLIVDHFVYIYSWSQLALVAVFCGVGGYAINVMLMLNRSERDRISTLLLAKFKR